MLFLKTGIFGGALFLITVGKFGILPILFFAGVSLALYLHPLFVGYYYGWKAFFILIWAAILGMKIVADSFLFLPGVIFFSYIFYLILGVKDFLFIKRSRLYYIAALLLFYAIFIIFFLADKSNWFFLKYGGVIAASFLFFREWLALISSFHFPRREFIAAAASSLIVAQLLWGTALLPIGFIGAANLMLLVVLTLGNFLFAHFTGGITRVFLIWHFIFFSLLIALIFGVS